MYNNDSTIIIEKYIKIEELETSTFSKTYIVLNNSDNKKYCMKVIKKNNDYFQQSLMEIYILTYLKKVGQKKDNFFQIIDYFFTNGQLYIITELLEQDLYKKFIKPKKKLSLPKIKKYLKSLLTQLLFLKKNGVIHCDIKPENILLTNKGKNLKLIDYGSSTFLDDVSYWYLQTRPYRAPEISLGLPFDFSVDIWSLGCLFYELLTFDLLFGYGSVSENICKAMSINEIYNCDFFKKGRKLKEFVFKERFLFEEGGLKNGFFVLIPTENNSNARFIKNLDGFDKDLVDLIKGFLKLDPKERLTPEKALKHKFFSKK